MGKRASANFPISSFDLDIQCYNIYLKFDVLNMLAIFLLKSTPLFITDKLNSFDKLWHFLVPLH